MSTLLLIALGVPLLLAGAAALRLALARRGSDRVHPPRRRRAARIDPGLREREAAIATQVQVEEHDIDEMIEARNALRRRSGKSSIGDELAEEIRRGTRDGA